MITLLHPSRGRPNLAFNTFNSWILKSSGSIEIEHILSIDITDPYKEDYIRLFKDSIIELNDNKNLVEATNIAAKTSRGDIIILLSDDFDCCNNWDKLIVQAFKGQTNKLLKTYDGLQKWIVTLFICDRAFYESEGYIYYPEYSHMFCDSDLTHKSELQGKKLVRNDLFFKHVHHFGGLAPKDEIHYEAELSWKSGEQLYLKRVREKFGLGDHVDVFKLCMDAHPHLKWLKSKL